MKRVVYVAIAIATWLIAVPAAAHAVGVSRGEYVVEDRVVRVSASFARGELAQVVPSLDPDGDGTITPAELALAHDALGAVMTREILVTSSGAACPGSFEGARLTEGDGVAAELRYTCPDPPTKLEIDARGLLGKLLHGHRHLVHAVIGRAVIDEIAFRGHDVVAVADQASSKGRASDVPSSLGFVRMGVEHILTGYDHLVFLLGLVVVGGRLRSMLTVVTAFTIAHSVTLATAALGFWAPPSRVIEPLIALSVAYVGVENFFVASVEKRWRITFPFGLIHGFGFAGALREIALPRAQIPSALVLFNAGVEVGQIAVMALALPLVLFLRSNGNRTRCTFALSGAVALAGLFWFVVRIAGS
jgi:hypothetical protein